MPSRARQVLCDALNKATASSGEGSHLRQSDLNRLRRIMLRVEANKNVGVLSVLITLLVKKVMKPQQDVRLHQVSIPGGFSGRGLDTKHITPFLRENNFPYMTSGSGWLTRSLEQAAAYTLNYPGQIKPASIKEDFLKLLHAVEERQEPASKYLEEIFRQLVVLRERSQNISLSIPKNKSIRAVVSLIENFWESSTGTSRIPVIAVFAAYQCIVQEVRKYKNHQLLHLLPQNAADQRTGRTGDIDLKLDSKIDEAVEIKHGIRITPELVTHTIEKIKRTTVRRYYILSTNERLKGIEDITLLTTKARHNYGCEIIVNGVAATLTYYLRLISNPDVFIENFISILEKDEDVSYRTKMAWDTIVSNAENQDEHEGN